MGQCFSRSPVTSTVLRRPSVLNFVKMAMTVLCLCVQIALAMDRSCHFTVFLQTQCEGKHELLLFGGKEFTASLNMQVCSAHFNNNNFAKSTSFGSASILGTKIFLRGF